MPSLTLSKLPVANEVARKNKTALIDALQAFELEGSDENTQAARLALQQLMTVLRGRYDKKDPKRDKIFEPVYEVSLEKVAHTLNQLPAKQKHALFSNADIQITAKRLMKMDALFELTDAIKDKTWQAFIRTRQENGFTHFIADLKDNRHNKKGQEWTLTNGLLTITVKGMTSPQTAKEIHKHLNTVFEAKSWYQPPKDEPVTNDFLVNVKTLGANGRNKAVDPILLITGSDGRIKVLCGERHDGSYAFPGGMNESNVIQTCIDELIEECFSGALFTKGSLSATKLDSLPINKTSFSQALYRAALVGYKLNAPKESDNDYAAKLVKYNEGCTKVREEVGASLAAVSTSHSTAIQAFIAAIEANRQVDAGQKPAIIAGVRRSLYHDLLAGDYQELERFVKRDMRKEPLVINRTDPRNTNYAFMATNPLEMVIDEDKATEFFSKSCSLTFAAGDDLGKVAFRDITTFAQHAVKTEGSEHYTYSDHAVLLLEAVNRAINRGELQMTPILRVQLSEISQTNLDKPFTYQPAHQEQQLPLGHAFL